MKGIIVPKTIGIGDAIQFTSVPHNHFWTTGEKLIDMEGHWIFDYNPFVVRNEVPTEVFRLWNYNPPYKPANRAVYTSLAEKHAGILGSKVTLRHPRLYAYEDFPFHYRKMILVQVEGRSQGRLPDNVIKHVVDKYKSPFTFQIGLKNEEIGLPWIETKTLWELAELISGSRMVIGPDSGPTWIAACYPDVIVKKLRLNRPGLEALQNWVPLDVGNLHAQWDDLQLHQVYNHSEEDVGFTSSYKKL